MDQDRQDEILQRFGKRLQELRKATDLSVRNFGEHAELDYSNISSIENGSVNVTLLTITQLAEALGISPAAFFTNEDPAEIVAKIKK